MFKLFFLTSVFGTAPLSNFFNAASAYFVRNSNQETPKMNVENTASPSFRGDANAINRARLNRDSETNPMTWFNRLFESDE